MLNLITTVITAIVGAVLVGVIVFVAIWRVQHARKQELNHNPSVVGVETIVPEVRRKSNGQIFSPEAVRAQKFRERARTTTIGKPEFKLSQKKFKHDIYKTLANHPNFKDFEEFYKEHHKPDRRVSEDRTSYGNSTIDDISEIGGGGGGNGRNFQRGNSLIIERQLFTSEEEELTDLPDV
eukprot:gene13545-14904_t